MECLYEAIHVRPSSLQHQGNSCHMQGRDAVCAVAAVEATHVITPCRSWGNGPVSWGARCNHLRATQDNAGHADTLPTHGHPQQPKFFFFTNTETTVIRLHRSSPLSHGIIGSETPSHHIRGQLVPPQPRGTFLIFYTFFFLSRYPSFLSLDLNPPISYRFVRFSQHFTNQKQSLLGLDATTGFPNPLRHCPTWLTRTIIGYKSPTLSPAPDPRSPRPASAQLFGGWSHPVLPLVIL